MIAVSSFKPFAKSSEYARNQERAAKSWHGQFSNIFYYGRFEDGLNEENVLFVRSDNEWPTIKEMADFASHIKADYVSILNADIVVTSPITAVERKMMAATIPAASSYRLEFDPNDYPDLSKAARIRENRGLDIFVAKPSIWAEVAKAIPAYLRVGHPTWDSWLCGFLADRLGFGYRSFTHFKCVYHPKHGGRETPHSSEIKNDEKYFTMARVPSDL